jgi:hypothetical protein
MHDPPARHPSTPVPRASPRGEQRHPPPRPTARAQDSLSPGQREHRTLAECSLPYPTGAFGELAIDADADQSIYARLQRDDEVQLKNWTSA